MAPGRAGQQSLNVSPHFRDGRVLGVLEVSRSIGDGQYKRCGVTSVPDIRRCQLTPNDR